MTTSAEREEDMRHPQAECTHCGHYFDPSDERAFVPTNHPDRISCPACTIMVIHSVEAWAVYNDCQGVFTCGIEATKADALARLESGEYSAACTVVPVRIIEEPKENRYFREWSEQDRADR